MIVYFLFTLLHIVLVCHYNRIPQQKQIKGTDWSFFIHTWEGEREIDREKKTERRTETNTETSRKNMNWDQNINFCM